MRVPNGLPSRSIGSNYGGNALTRAGPEFGYRRLTWIEVETTVVPGTVSEVMLDVTVPAPVSVASTVSPMRIAAPGVPGVVVMT